MQQLTFVRTLTYSHLTPLLSLLVCFSLQPDPRDNAQADKCAWNAVFQLVEPLYRLSQDELQDFARPDPRDARCLLEGFVQAHAEPFEYNFFEFSDNVLTSENARSGCR